MSQAHYDSYRDQLASLYHGHALWEPDPAPLYDRVRVGDVGYVKRGRFFRMFNVLLQADDDAQVYGVPEGFVQLNMGPFGNICTLNLPQGEYCSNTVRVVRRDGHQADGPGEPTSATFRCRTNNTGGAFLSLPFSGVRENAIRIKAFETYIRKHCDSWLEFTVINGLDVTRLEDIILVTGCDLTSSWAMGASTNPLDLDREMTLHVQTSEANGSAVFQWSPMNQPRNNESNQNTEKSHCVFLRGFRAKRILPLFKTLKAAAEPRPDNPDNEPESSIELVREPTLPDYRDPLMGILDYIAEQRPNDDIALAHEDDLKMVQRVDVLTADAVENFLRQYDIPVQTKEGLALLADTDEEEAPEEERMTFHALANVCGESLPLIVHPVLVKYLKFDITQPLDHDFGLPKEEFFSSAVYPPVHVLILENEQGLPQNIEVQASDKGSGIGVTVEDVLKSIGADLQKSSNYLRGRNRLQVFPRQSFSEEEEELVQPLMPYIRTSDMLESAGSIPQAYALNHSANHLLNLHPQPVPRISTMATKQRHHARFNEDPFWEVRSISSPASSTSSLYRSPSPPPPLLDVAFSSPTHSPSHAPISSFPSPPRPRVYTPSPRVYLHTALAAPGLQYNMRYLPHHSNFHLSPAVLAEPASSPPLPSLPIRVAGLPWHCTVWPDPKLSLVNAVVTVQDVLVCLYFYIRTAVKTDEYNAMNKGRKAEIFQAFERRVGHDPVQRGIGLRRVDFLRGHIIAQGLVRAQSKDDVWDVVIL